MKYIFKNYSLSLDEFNLLDKNYRNLVRFAAWQLIRKNVKNNHTDELEDIEQDLLIAVIRAGVYYKRQLYIEECLKLCNLFAKDRIIKEIVDELQFLWNNRTKHGANKQKFGEQQEKILECLVEKLIPAEMKPDKNKTLKIDKKFTTYCKQIAWNQQKNLGKKITRERSVRSNLVSLSCNPHLVA